METIFVFERVDSGYVFLLTFDTFEKGWEYYCHREMEVVKYGVPKLKILHWYKSKFVRPKGYSWVIALVKDEEDDC